MRSFLEIVTSQTCKQFEGRKDMELHITIYAILAGMTLIMAAYFIADTLFGRRSRKSAYSFALLSFTVFVLSLSHMVMMVTQNRDLARLFSFFLQGAIYLFPAALFHYTVDTLDYNFFRKDWVKFFFYIPSSGIILWILFFGRMEASQAAYGFTIHEAQAMLLGIFYLVPLLMLTIAYVGYNLYRTLKTNYPLTRVVLLLAGISIFALATSLLRPIEAVYRLGIPYNAILMFVLFMAIAVSDYATSLNIESITFAKMFESIDDCILVVDKNGRILEINARMRKILFGDTHKRKNLDSSQIRDRMLQATTSKSKLTELFEYFQSDSFSKLNKDLGCNIQGQTRYYNVTASPIVYGKNKILGKIAIFRDITEKRMLEKRLKDESIKDFLTGAFNRRHFYHMLEHAVQSFNRYKTPFSILLIDIDHFKQLNDRLGHLEGDWLLSKVAEILSGNIRKGLDTVTRYGGDEFIVLLTHAGRKTAVSIANRIIGDFKKIDSKGTFLSIGISQFYDGMSASDVINEADSAMYRAKQENKDSIQIGAHRDHHLKV